MLGDLFCSFLSSMGLISYVSMYNGGGSTAKHRTIKPGSFFVWEEKTEKKTDRED